jgi:hypothetical protein
VAKAAKSVRLEVGEISSPHTGQIESVQYESIQYSTVGRFSTQGREPGNKSKRRQACEIMTPMSSTVLSVSSLASPLSPGVPKKTSCSSRRPNEN